ncbi:50S ribosomal protein L10 [Candidatus Solincola sp.]|nr:50S ribosomal protein L10 [Actinomycetota bacterium]MDI7250954.1 50S ribosomal protein L10 [Actinomycetota bacterium]
MERREETMPREEKIARVEEMRNRFLSSRFIFLTDFTGLKAEEMNALRFKLREKGGEYRVLKNTLALLAIRDTEYQSLGELLVGPVGAVFGSEDPVAVAKELAAYARENPNLKVKGGFLEGRLLDAAEVRSLALLPPREVLLGRLVGSLKGSLYGLHGVLSGPYRKLVYALRAVAEEKSKAA